MRNDLAGVRQQPWPAINAKIAKDCTVFAVTSMIIRCDKKTCRCQDLHHTLVSPGVFAHTVGEVNQAARFALG
jgi:hypothetical protein